MGDRGVCAVSGRADPGWRIDGRSSRSLRLSSHARAEIDRQLRKIAGADVTQVSSIPPPERRVVRATIDGEFVFAFRLVMFGAAGLALAAAGFGTTIRPSLTDR